MAKKKGYLKGLGARYGIKLRKKYSIVHRVLKSKRKCPECGSSQFGRQVVGIWSCKKCGFKIAGYAYDIKL
ncbi:50S ribosomal protein L37 [Marine Group I thaumarchaeote]|uniref:Large ribosomal subunit protein eL43 n=1 Tax=Marine Group I thaumarchaeote TaxID=2511932 RepID=A0A7K4MMB2_9ARCH|nr:50S ribosomal protein L37 [Marine Group I thaumarchaeote]NWJ68569.1 50S ribosomal protein L37 [Marine Group I thaumarchaeote]